MTTNIKDVAQYLEDLFGTEMALHSDKNLGNHTLSIKVHDKSTNINAASVEVEVKLLDENNEPTGKIARSMVLVVEKSTLSPKSKEPFVRTCSIVFNDMTREIVWDKMARDSTKYAAEYCFGYVLNSVLILRGEKTIRNIKDYVRSIVERVEGQNDSNEESAE